MHYPSGYMSRREMALIALTMNTENGSPDPETIPPRPRNVRHRFSRSRAFFSEEDPDATAFLNALEGLNAGDYSVRLPLHWTGTARRAAAAFEGIVLASERAGERKRRTAKICR